MNNLPDINSLDHEERLDNNKVIFTGAAKASDTIKVLPHELPAEACEYQWYQAPVGAGCIGLGVSYPGRQAPQAASAKAMLLAREELLVQYLESWVGVELDFYPVSEAVQGTIGLSLSVPDHITAAASDIDTSQGFISPSVKIELPIEIALKVSKPDWQELLVDWQSLESRLVLSKLALSVEELNRLESGSLVLLPGSSADMWPMAILSSATGVQTSQLNTPVVMAICRNAIEMAGPSERVSAGQDNVNLDLESKPALAQEADNSFSFSCTLDCSVPFDFLRGWQTEPTECSAKLLTQIIASDRNAIELRRGETVVARGHLFPIGDSFGLLVTERGSD